MATIPTAIRLLQALAVLIFISSTFTAITLQQLQESFYVELDIDSGGNCDRDLEGTEMLPKVLAAFEDAWLLSSAGSEIPPSQIRARTQNEVSAYTFTRLRALLFLFFGVVVTSLGQFDPVSYGAYNNILSEFQGVSGLQTEPADPFGWGLPIFRCLEDCAQFYVHLADEAGLEDDSLSLAAEYYDQRYPGPNGDFLPGLLYDRGFDEYYPGPLSDPEVGYCEAGDRFAFAIPVSGPATQLYGITVCEGFFGLDSFGSIPEIDGPATDTSQTFIGTSGAVLLTELLLMESRTGLLFQPRVEPTDDDWTSTDWAQWVFSDTSEGYAVSMTDCINLGLAKPSYALKNAPSYVHFALCLGLPDLDCTSSLPEGALAP